LKNDYGIEREARALNGMEEPLKSLGNKQEYIRHDLEIN
jgi:hypothetical protein